MIRIAICDDDKTVVQGLEAILAAEADLTVVATAHDGETALAHDGDVDVWLMDVRLPGMSGVEVARELGRRANAPKVLLMTAYDVGAVLEAIDTNVGGFIHKGELLLHVATAVRAVHAGFQVGNEIVTAAIRQHIDRMSIVDPDRAARIVRDDLDRQLLELVLESRSIADMAETLSYSTSGIHKRLSRLFQRAEVRNQRALVAWLVGHR